MRKKCGFLAFPHTVPVCVRHYPYTVQVHPSAVIESKPRGTTCAI